jgi:hypothetical protein
MKVNNYKGYDEFMIPVNRKDKTWKSILGDIETVLDDRFIDNKDTLEGISLKLDFVVENPADIEMIDEY